MNEAPGLRATRQLLLVGHFEDAQVVRVLGAISIVASEELHGQQVSGASDR
jgi:hypothetical protein